MPTGKQASKSGQTLIPVVLVADVVAPAFLVACLRQALIAAVGLFDGVATGLLVFCYSQTQMPFISILDGITTRHVRCGKERNTHKQ